MLTREQLQTLRHMLGIDTPNDRVPKPYRDYYCANPDDAHLLELECIGAVECYSKRDGYRWYRCTPMGRTAAMTSHQTIRNTKASRVYSRFLDVKDAFADLTFKQFLTDPQFAQTRREA